MRWQLFALILGAILTCQTAFAGDASCCKQCGETCYPTVTKGTVSKHCWDYQTKTICIPRVRFPWESSCCDKTKDGCLPAKPGRTKQVKVLVKHEYKCSVCKYSWTPKSAKRKPYGEPAAASADAGNPALSREGVGELESQVPVISASDIANVPGILAKPSR